MADKDSRRSSKHRPLFRSSRSEDKLVRRSMSSGMKTLSIDASPQSSRRTSLVSTSKYEGKGKSRRESSPVKSRRELGVLIMGVTGSGKSTLISRLTDQDVGIGHSLESCMK
jgi:ribosome biogenesis GTPase A